jgi:hypothetical protein
MQATRLSLFLCFVTGRLLAQGSGDPFTPYHQALEQHLSTILASHQRAGNETPDTPRVDPAPVANNNKGRDIHAFSKLFWGGRDAQLAAALDRLDQLRPTVEPILDNEGVPRELLAVVLIESAAQPFAASPREARGLWQFIPGTARQYGLAVTGSVDERVSVGVATRAAARYLRDLYSHFQDWPLALAGYNAGQGAVDGALERSGASTFWQLKSSAWLPEETRNYVPAVLAAMQLLNTKPISVPGAEVQRNPWVYASLHVVD